MSKTYSLSEMRKVVCWPDDAGAALKLLASHGIVPQVEVQFGKRTLRLYDESAMESAKVLRQAHDEDVKARRAAHAANMRAKFARELAEIKATPKPTKATRAQRAQADVQALSTLVEATSVLLTRVEALHAKLDALAAQHSLQVNFDDEPALNGGAA